MKNYCKYHPLIAATYYCPQCQNYSCDDCTDEDGHKEEGVCFLCQQATQSLGSADSEEPFWKRLDFSFKYPLNTHTLILIGCVSILNIIVMFVPLTILWQLMLTGAMMSYCFACLKQTAMGKFTAPDISVAYEGGLLLLAKLFAIFFVMFLFVGLVAYVLGPRIGNLAFIIAVVFIPAAIILFGLSDSLAEALNPLKQLRLITAVGLPYGLILGFVLVMIASVSVINELIGIRFSVLGSMMEAIVSNYYTVVLFHIMGYMIFQYQRELGFSARADHGQGKVTRDEAEKAKHLVDILIKEADFKAALKELQSGFKKFPNDPYFIKQCLEFSLATRDAESIVIFGSLYLGFLIRHQEFHQLNTVYKRILQVKPKFQADTAEIRYQLAIALHQAGDPKSAAKVLNHLHKEFPNYEQLAPAYELMAMCLGEMPGMEKQAQQYQQFAAKLSKETKQRPPTQDRPHTKQGEEPGPIPPDEQPQPVHSLVDQDAINSLTLVPVDDGDQDTENEQSKVTPASINHEEVNGLSLIPVDK